MLALPRSLSVALLTVLLLGAGPVAAQVPAPARPAATEPADAPPVVPPRSAEPEAATSGGAAAPAQPLPTVGRGMPELSPWSMFMNADLLVKIVMVGLAFASLLTWTIFLGKSAELFIAGRRLKAAVGRLCNVGTLDEAYQAQGRTGDVVGRLINEARDEVRLSQDILDDAGIKERASARFGEVVKGEGLSIRRGMGLLATMGSTSPFVGLFGTVWGIMNSFIGISKAQTTNLAVVAPGIAEALLATAIGLVAAIPAVIIYNHFTRATRGYLDSAARAAGLVGRLLSRDLARARSGIGGHGPVLARAAE